MGLQDNVRRFEAWKQMITDIERAVEDDSFDLDDWATEFLESVKRRIEAMDALTERQDAALANLWSRATQ